MTTTFALQESTRKGQRNRVCLCAFGCHGNSRLNIHRTRLANRLDEILGWIDQHKTDNRPATDIMAEIGLCRVIFETAMQSACHPRTSQVL